MVKIIYIILLIGVCILCYRQYTFADCRDFPAPDFKITDQQTYTGRYINKEFGFSVVIPKGSTGFNTPPPRPDNGIGILLSSNPNSFVSFIAQDGSVQLERFYAESITNLREEAEKVLSIKRVDTILDNMKAIRYIAKYTCVAKPGVFINEAILAYNSERRIFYASTLLTTGDKYKKDGMIFNKILKTWRLIPLAPHYSVPFEGVR
ncbi:MAG TPA: hypothetical protein VMB78_05715 [Dissulfurispiraceae bacterium]|nr:hypothetical protein [Dissulfurispiraceae bacterium]